MGLAQRRGQVVVGLALFMAQAARLHQLEVLLQLIQQVAVAWGRLLLVGLTRYLVVVVGLVHAVAVQILMVLVEVLAHLLSAPMLVQVCLVKAVLQPFLQRLVPPPKMYFYD